jgi:lysozyme family protein
MQKTLKVKDDGIIGPKTIAAAFAAQPRAFRLVLAERLAAYARLMAAKPNLLVFATNWSFRVLSLARLLKV